MNEHVAGGMIGKLARAAAAAAAAAGCAGLAAERADAGLLIDLRAVTLNDQPLPAGSTAERVVVDGGDVVGINVIARVSGTNAVDDEGFQSMYGVFRSTTGGLLGDLSASTVAPFNGLGSQNGSRIDVDGDGDLDIGDIPNGGINTLTAYWVARSNIVQRDGTPVATDPAAEEFVIGTLTWTATSAPAPGSETFVDFIRRRNPGNPGTNGSAYSRWDEDGSGTASVRNGADPYATDGLRIEAVPEPASTALATVAALGLLARRRRP